MLRLLSSSVVRRLPRSLLAARAVSSTPGSKYTSDIGRQPADPEYDVCVIGCGPAGFAAAMRAWDFGKKVCIVERSRLGGTAVHNGALSSKTMWELSRDYINACKKDRAFVAEKVDIQYGHVVDVVNQAVSEKVQQISRQIQELSYPVPGRDGRLTLVVGTAVFADPWHIRVNADKAGVERIISARNFVIATGSKPRKLNNIEVDGEYIMTSDHLLQLKQFPKR